VAALDWTRYITVDPAICHGQACITGTRVPVAVVLSNLAAGVSGDEFHRNYPSVSPDAVRAALAYAAELAGEHVVALPT
jgi:uncharacterized protein (DUF433 family)